jgi:aryl-alcohol dehydrogenase-like predicted oxidoreductase
MQTRRIGSLNVSVVGLGCNNFGWRIDSDATVKVVDAALDAGIDFFDTADIYGSGHSEEFLGRALGPRRKDVIVATKFGMKMDEQRSGARPEYVLQAAEDSLRRLGTDYIDLYQQHQPDPTVPIAETLGALDQLVRAGKVREIGCSNFSAEQIREAEAAVRPGAARFVSVQNQYSLLHRDPEADVLPECERLGIAFLPYFPLANGLLTGKYRRGQPHPEGSRGAAGFGPKVFTNEKIALAESFAEFATSRGHTLLELAFAWLLSRPAVASVIAGAKTVEQVHQNAAAAGWILTESDISALPTPDSRLPTPQLPDSLTPRLPDSRLPFPPFSAFSDSNRTLEPYAPQTPRPDPRPRRILRRGGSARLQSD